MPSPFANDRSPNTRRFSGQEPQSRTGKFLQGIFGSGLKQPLGSSPENQPIIQPPQELIQVISEPSTWDEGEESNWDDDFMYEPKAKVSQPDLVETPTPTVIEVSASLPSDDQTLPTAEEVEEVVLSPTTGSQTVSVNIPRPKNIKYKTKDSQASPPVSPQPAVAFGDKVEVVEFNVKRPTAIKYKAKPLEKPSWIAQILAPGRELWKKITGWGDIIPTQLTENPRKVLGMVAAVLLSIATSWVVVNFWPSQSEMASSPTTITSAAVAQVTPEETLVAAVRSQFSSLASQYPVGLISNLELDNERQLAIVTLGNLWGNLTGEQQQQVAQSLWQQAITYQMVKLEMRSSGGNLLARSPIVGQQMVILGS